MAVRRGTDDFLSRLARAEARDASSKQEASPSPAKSSPSPTKSRFSFKARTSFSAVEKAGEQPPAAAPSRWRMSFGRGGSSPSPPRRRGSRSAAAASRETRWLADSPGPDAKPSSGSPVRAAARALRQRMSRSVPQEERSSRRDSAAFSLTAERDADAQASRAQFLLGSSEADPRPSVSAEAQLKAKVATKVMPALALARTQHAGARAAAAKTAAPEPFRSDEPSSAEREVWSSAAPTTPPWAVETPHRDDAAPPHAEAAITAAPALGALGAAAFASCDESCGSCVTHAQRSKQRREVRLEQKRAVFAQARAAASPESTWQQPAAAPRASAPPWREGSDGVGSGGYTAAGAAGARPTAAAARKQAYRDILAASAVVALKRLDDAASRRNGGVAEAAAEATRADMGALIECFEEADVDMSGEIDARECELALAALHRRWPDEPRSMPEVAGSGFAGHFEVRTASELMFAQLDLDFDGRVTFADFVMHRQRQHWARLRTRQPLSRKLGADR